MKRIFLFPTVAFLFLGIASVAFPAGIGASVCSVQPPPGRPSRVYRDGSSLCWNGKPLRLSGYYTTDLATRDGFDYATFLNTIRYVDNADSRKRHGVNFMRIWATGTSNTPSCNHSVIDHDPLERPTTMPFPLLPGQSCSAQNPYPRYDMCISAVDCAAGGGLDRSYRTRLQNILAESRRNGIIVALVLFDAYYLGRHQTGQALYARNPWNPLNNNMGQARFRRHPGQMQFGSCNRLYTSTDTSDLTDDAFPEFYDICSDAGSTLRCDQTLNCLGLIEKAYVLAMVDLVKSTPGGSDHVFFEIMNRPRFDKNDSSHEGFDLNKFRRWNDVVGRWIKCRGDGDCRNTPGDYLVLAEVGIADYRDLVCTNRADCPINPLDALAVPNIDVLNFQAHTWNNSPGAPGPCDTAMAALDRFRKPVIIDTDSAIHRVDKCMVARWAAEVRDCGNPGQVHFNQLDGMSFGYPGPRTCSFRGAGSPRLYVDFDEKYLDCHTLDTIGAADPTFLSELVTTGAPPACPHSISLEGNPTWCSAACSPAARTGGEDP